MIVAFEGKCMHCGHDHNDADLRKLVPAMINNGKEMEKLQSDKARLIQAVNHNQKALLVLRTMCDTNGLKAGAKKAYEMFEENNLLLAVIEKGGE